MSDALSCGGRRSPAARSAAPAAWPVPPPRGAFEAATTREPHPNRAPSRYSTSALAAASPGPTLNTGPARATRELAPTTCRLPPAAPASPPATLPSASSDTTEPPYITYMAARGPIRAAATTCAAKRDHERIGARYRFRRVAEGKACRRPVGDHGSYRLSAHARPRRPCGGPRGAYSPRRISRYR